MRVLLLEVFTAPRLCLGLDDSQWDILIPQARNSGLLASLGLLLRDEGFLDEIPTVVSRHFDSVIAQHEKQCQSVRYEAKWLSRALAEVGERLIVLKGGAYLLAGLPAGSGRLISDIDIIVPEIKLKDVEDVLARYGWKHGKLDAYDERYYRQWMHEIPPMAHEKRGSVLDVHHTILPPTANAHLDPAKLFSASVKTESGVYTLGPLDMVIHSAAHLFHEGEFNNGLRDLLDLDRLLRFFSTEDENFWTLLTGRAQELTLGLPLYYALRYTKMYFLTPVPQTAIAALDSDRPGVFVRKFLDFVFSRAFMPVHPQCEQSFTSPALLFLYVRSHYLRMPMRLLIPHLVRKYWRGIRLFAKNSDDFEPAK